MALFSSIAIAFWPVTKSTGLEMWTFSKNHGQLYQKLSSDYNAQARAEGRLPVNVSVIDTAAVNRRTLSGFWSGTPLADLIEVERASMPSFVSGPLEHVGFVDLTDRLKSEEFTPGVSIYDSLNVPSFGPWTSRGRIFGLPHDVHPVMLVYRSDLVEAAGIDVSTIETWDDFARVMAPLKTDLDGDGSIDRWLINSWYTNPDVLQALTLQAGGGTFDHQDNLLVASEGNATVIARMVEWSRGETRIAIDAPEFSASGNQLRVEGKVVASVMPDWLAGVWKENLPQLGGKLKLMPLPAWEPGGRRTSVLGGTMIGIPKATFEQSEERFEEAWEVAKHLYLSEGLARQSFEASNIISAVKAFWSKDFYHQPDAYFSGQQSGTRFLELAPHVPFRSSNTFHILALTRIQQAANRLYQRAEDENLDSREELVAAARELLDVAQAEVVKEMSFNVFLNPPKSDDAQTQGGEGDE